MSSLGNAPRGKTEKDRTIGGEGRLQKQTHAERRISAGEFNALLKRSARDENVSFEPLYRYQITVIHRMIRWILLRRNWIDISCRILLANIFLNSAPVSGINEHIVIYLLPRNG